MEFIFWTLGHHSRSWSSTGTGSAGASAAAGAGGRWHRGTDQGRRGNNTCGYYGWSLWQAVASKTCGIDYWEFTRKTCRTFPTWVCCVTSEQPHPFNIRPGNHFSTTLRRTRPGRTCWKGPDAARVSPTTSNAQKLKSETAKMNVKQFKDKNLHKTKTIQNENLHSFKNGPWSPVLCRLHTGFWCHHNCLREKNVLKKNQQFYTTSKIQ